MQWMRCWRSTDSTDASSEPATCHWRWGVSTSGTYPAHPAVSSLIDRVRTDTIAAGKLVMEPAGSGEAARRIIGLGVQIVVLQFGQFLRTALDGYLTAARGTGSAR